MFYVQNWINKNFFNPLGMVWYVKQTDHIKQTEYPTSK